LLKDIVSPCCDHTMSKLTPSRHVLQTHIRIFANDRSLKVIGEGTTKYRGVATSDLIKSYAGYPTILVTKLVPLSTVNELTVF
jgi:hypothetical protein